MRLFSIFKRNKRKDVPERTINGIPLTKLPNNVYENMFPWSSDQIPNTNLTVGNIVMLWWLDKYHGTNRTIPLYFERNYVKSFSKELMKLKKDEWIYKDESLSPKAKKVLHNNFDIIEKHRVGWMNEADRKTFAEARRIEMNIHNQWLINNGMEDIAERNKQMMLKQDADMIITRKFKKAETMSKNNELAEANKILERLIESNTEYPAIIYERLAKNYRKQKRYQDEINLCMRFLKNEQPKYDEDQWINIFEKRIAFSESKLSKHSNTTLLD